MAHPILNIKKNNVQHALPADDRMVSHTRCTFVILYTYIQNPRMRWTAKCWAAALCWWRKARDREVRVWRVFNTNTNHAQRKSAKRTMHKATSRSRECSAQHNDRTAAQNLAFADAPWKHRRVTTHIRALIVSGFVT